MEAYNKADLKNSFYYGIFAHMFATLTSGVFLTGFAQYLGMNDLMIGLLAALPFLVTAFQLPTSYFIIKNGRIKRVVLIQDLGIPGKTDINYYPFMAEFALAF